MQAWSVILFSLATAFCLPLLLIAVSAYSLYNSIAIAKVARRHNEDMLRAVNLGQKTLRTESAAKKQMRHKSPKAPVKKSPRGTKSPKSPNRGTSGFKSPSNANQSDKPRRSPTRSPNAHMRHESPRSPRKRSASSYESV